jgi:AraC family transcriptional regulator
VMEYVKLRRLAHVADKLREDGGKILELALEYGFQNHETLTRSFKETYGMTPEAYRGNPVFLSHFIMSDLSLKYHLIDEGVPPVADGIVLEIKRKTLCDSVLFAGASVQNPIDGTPGVDILGELWRQFHERLYAAIPNKVEEGRQIGISSVGREPGFFTYFAGAEVSRHTGEWLQCTAGDKEHENRELPAGEYIVCTFSAENFHNLTTNALNKAVGYLFGTWLPGHKCDARALWAKSMTGEALERRKGPRWIFWSGWRRTWTNLS